MQRLIKFTHTGHSALVGNFSSGDVFRGSEAQCRHFVEEARCAEWADVVTDTPAGDTPAGDTPAGDAPAGASIVKPKGARK